MYKKNKLSQYFMLMALLSACTPPTPEEQLKAYNKRLGSQGELTTTHLYIYSSGQPSGLPPVTFKIPIEYLVQSSPIDRNSTGEIEKVYFRFSFPEGTPFKNPPDFSSAENDSKKRAEAIAYNDKQITAYIDLNSMYGGNYNNRTWLKNKDNYWAGTPITGLERYDSYQCYNTVQQSDSGTQAWLKQKEKDDTTPANCRKYFSFYMLSPESVTDEDKKVSMSCDSDRCSVYFRAANRTIHISIWTKLLPQWPQQVEIARSLVNRFWVKDNTHE